MTYGAFWRNSDVVIVLCARLSDSNEQVWVLYISRTGTWMADSPINYN